VTLYPDCVSVYCRQFAPDDGPAPGPGPGPEVSRGATGHEVIPGRKQGFAGWSGIDAEAGRTTHQMYSA